MPNILSLTLDPNPCPTSCTSYGPRQLKRRELVQDLESGHISLQIEYAQFASASTCKRDIEKRKLVIQKYVMTSIQPLIQKVGVQWWWWWCVHGVRACVYVGGGGGGGCGGGCGGGGGGCMCRWLCW